MDAKGTSARIRQAADQLLLAVDLLGTLIFAVEGGLAGAKAGLDVFGLMVLAFVTALGGGITRDLLIGAIPPNSIRDWRYAATALLGGGIVFVLYGIVQQVPTPVLVVLDAAGLSLFAVAGTVKARAYGIHPLLAAMMGTITGAGGGTIRDVFLAQVPAVLRTDIYAVAAFCGAVVFLAMGKLRAPAPAAAAVGAAVCFGLRLTAWTFHWSLPYVRR